MPWGAAAIAVGTVAAASIAADAQQNAANTQSNAALAQQANLLAAGKKAAQQFQPYADVGTTALANLNANNPYFNKQFSNADLNAQLAPNYAFMLNQGQNANLMGSNVTGGAVSGNALKSLQDYTQNYAANAYQNAFSNFQTQRGNINAMNMNLANLGLAGATGSANAELGTATNVANIGLGAANATAASQIAQGNIYGGAANTLGNIGYMYANQPSTPQTSGQYMNSIGAGGGSNQYFGSNSNGLGAGGTAEFNSMIGLA